MPYMRLPGQDRRCTCRRCVPLGQKRSKSNPIQRQREVATGSPTIPSSAALGQHPEHTEEPQSTSQAYASADLAPPVSDPLSDPFGVSPGSVPSPVPRTVPPPSLPLPWVPPPSLSPSPQISELPEHHQVNDPPNQSTNVRVRVRHSFDIFTDQLLSLREIALRRERRSGLRTRLGDLVQHALDVFITQEKEAERAQAEPGAVTTTEGQPETDKT